jgi:galactosamine-6-phosphate isomerase
VGEKLMDFTQLSDHGALSRRAAEIIWEAAEAKPDLLICLASGETPTKTYEVLAEAPERLAAARFIQLDEWAGLGNNDTASCAHYLSHAVLEPLAVPSERHIAFHGDAEDPAAECRRIEQALAASGPIDICILGLGRNGHLALNEPSDSLDPFCHVATLAKSSRAHPMLEDATTDVRNGLTLGLANILQSHKILLLVSGENKRGPLSNLAKRQVTSALPASFLWLHANTHCLCDEAAADHVDLDAA